eukprot:CFRG5860T1
MNITVALPPSTLKEAQRFPRVAGVVYCAAFGQTTIQASITTAQYIEAHVEMRGSGDIMDRNTNGEKLLRPLKLKDTKPTIKINALCKKLKRHTDGTEELDPPAHVAVLNEMVHFIREWKRTSEDYKVLIDNVSESMGESLVHEVKEVRAAALRVARFLVVDRETAEHIITRLFLLRACNFSLTAPDNYEVESTQAIKLIRSIIHHIPEHVPLSLVNTVAASASQFNEPISGVCVETLCELAITNPRATALAGGFATVTRAALYGDVGDNSIIQSVFVVLLYVFNYPATRVYMMDELELSLAAFTDTGYFVTLPNVAKMKQHNLRMDQPKEPIDHIDLLTTSGIAILTMLRTWPGVIFLFSSSRGMQSLVGNLITGDTDSKKETLKLISVVLGFEEPKWEEDFASATDELERSEMYPSVVRDLMRRRIASGVKLMSPYTSVLLAGLLNVGLLGNLSHLICHEDSTISVQATVLVGEILSLSGKYMPDSYLVQVQGVSTIVRMAATFTNNPDQRSRARTAISNLFGWRHKNEMLVESVQNQPKNSIIRLHRTNYHRKFDKNGFQIISDFQPSSGISGLQHEGEAFATSQTLATTLPTSPTNAYTHTSTHTRAHAHSPSLSHLHDAHVDNLQIRHPDDTGHRWYEQLDRLKNITYYNADEAFVNQLIRDTCVLTSANPLTWQWGNILVVIRGPLVNPSRLADSNSQRFIRRLLMYYTPSRTLYSAVKYQSNNIQTLVACQLLLLLLSDVDVGQKTLAEVPLLSELAHALEAVGASVDGFIPTPPLEALSTTSSISDNSEGNITGMTDIVANQIVRLFDEERINRTQARDYFAIIGVLTAFSDGIRMMERFKLDRGLYNVLGCHARVDLHRQILYSLDYSKDGHARVILQMLLSHEVASLRVLSTKHLAEWIRFRPLDFSTWGIPMLCEQIYDPDSEVRQAALDVLLEATLDAHCLAEAIAQRPALQHFGDAADPLYFRFLTLSSGIQYLASSGYLESRLLKWEESQCIEYVRVVEEALHYEIVKSHTRTPTRPRSERENTSSHRETKQMRSSPNLPLHLYGVLVHTEVGCRVVMEAQIVPALLYSLSPLDAPNTIDHANIRDIKAALWALAHVGSSDYGIRLLLDVDKTVVSRIIDLAESGSVLSLRGTAISALGLIALTEIGTEILEARQWGVVRDFVTKELCGITIPMNISCLFKIESTAFEGSYPQHMERGMLSPEKCSKSTSTGNNTFHSISDEQTCTHDNTETGNIEIKSTPMTIPPPTDPPCAKVYKFAMQVNQPVLTYNAKNQLMRLKRAEPQVFMRKDVFEKVFDAVEMYQFSVSSRRFLRSLFDVKEIYYPGSRVAKPTSPRNRLSPSASPTALLRSPSCGKYNPPLPRLGDLLPPIPQITSSPRQGAQESDEGSSVDLCVNGLPSLTRADICQGTQSSDDSPSPKSVSAIPVLSDVFAEDVSATGQHLRNTQSVEMNIRGRSSDSSLAGVDTSKVATRSPRRTLRTVNADNSARRSPLSSAASDPMLNSASNSRNNRNDTTKNTTDDIAGGALIFLPADTSKVGARSVRRRVPTSVEPLRNATSDPLITPMLESSELLIAPMWKQTRESCAGGNNAERFPIALPRDTSKVCARTPRRRTANNTSPLPKTSSDSVILHTPDSENAHVEEASCVPHSSRNPTQEHGTHTHQSPAVIDPVVPTSTDTSKVPARSVRRNCTSPTYSSSESLSNSTQSQLKTQAQSQLQPEDDTISKTER